MKVVVIGCGRLGSELAYRLYLRGHDVAVIDNVAAAFNNLPADFQGRIIEGEALSQDVLHRAGMEHTDALAAVTFSDALNAVTAYIGRVVYNIPNIVARNYDPRCRSLFETFNLQIVSSTSWGAQRMEELIYHSDVRMVYSTGNGEVELYEVRVPAALNDKPFQDLIGCDDCIPVSLTRAGKAILPGRETLLRTGDVAVISATFDGVESMRNRLRLDGKES